MSGLSPEEEEKKKAIFEAMSARSRKRILDKGYENWDPFLMPKDPLDMRMAQQRGAASALVREFLQTCRHEGYNNAYSQGAWEICMGIIGGDDRYRGIYDFSCWYREKLKKGDL
ncbi:MAG: hypothetical protein Q7J12_08195 [Syntrophales bacterium]|nr:hypothetical protein [Syntrophales bacterium]